MDRSVVEGLRRSKALIGPLHKIILDAEGNVVAGVHRREADSQWPGEIHSEIRTAKDRVLVRIHENYRKNMPKKKVREELLELAGILVKEGVPEQKVCELICDLVPYAPRYVQRLLPPRYKRSEGYVKRTSSFQLPDGVFDVILADPPWEYEFSLSDRGDPESHYSTMPLEKICALNVPSAEDAVLFLWATNPKLEEALKVMESWGFGYRTNLCWVKDKIGTGYYVRGQHELLLIGKKGRMSVPAEADRPPSVLISAVREHSQKPEEVYAIIEKMFPDRKYLELFARGNKRGNWVVWGNEVE